MAARHRMHAPHQKLQVPENAVGNRLWGQGQRNLSLSIFKQASISTELIAFGNFTNISYTKPRPAPRPAVRLSPCQGAGGPGAWSVGAVPECAGEQRGAETPSLRSHVLTTI